ncbi:MAG TPA: PadR family transcriptional regulator [Thermoanaerobaculia bacterium]|nr:PadR family transcriptional regulator [Thermoanaerobaculia bacterium]
MPADRHTTGRFLPLRPQWLHILLSLAAGPRHGYAIMNEVDEWTEGRVRLWPATLYNTLRQLLDERLIEEVDDPSEESGGPPRRPYALTPFGAEVLDAEARRMQALVDAVRSARAAGGGR